MKNAGANPTMSTREVFHAARSLGAAVELDLPVQLLDQPTSHRASSILQDPCY